MKRRKLTEEQERDKRLAYFRAYRERNKDRIATQARAWHKAHPQSRLNGNHRRRARVAGVYAESVYMPELYERDKGICGLCGLDVSLNQASIDHIIPISIGGPHTMENVQLAHRLCNVARKDKLLAPLPDDFLPSARSVWRTGGRPWKYANDRETLDRIMLVVRLRAPLDHERVALRLYWRLWQKLCEKQRAAKDEELRSAASVSGRTLPARRTRSVDRQGMAAWLESQLSTQGATSH